MTDGGNKRHFRPLWFGVSVMFRLDIKTGSQPLTIDDFYSTYTGYPFVAKASFTSNDSIPAEIMESRLAYGKVVRGETYFDCPYYEQLQYEGDTRIQSLISLYVQEMIG